MSDELRLDTSDGVPVRRAAVIQAHGTHDEIMPSLFETLLANGVEPTGFVSDRIERRGDIFGAYTPFGDRIQYGDFLDPQHWARLAEQMADYDLLVLNTMAYTGPANFARKLGKPTIGIVHNPPMMLNNPHNLEIIRSGQCTPATLAPHVTSWMMGHRPYLLSKTVTLGTWMWQMPSVATTDGRRRIAVPGAVDFAKRDYVSIVDALPDLIAARGRDDFVISVVGGGADRLALESLVRERRLEDVFEFAPLDEATGQVLSRDFYAGLASSDVLLPHLPTSQADYRVFKISAAISCAIGFGIPVVLDRWTAECYRIPCSTYPVGDIIAGLRCAVELSADELATMRAELATERTETVERAASGMATALSELGAAPASSAASAEAVAEESDALRRGPVDGAAVDPATIQRDDPEAFLAFAEALLRTTYSQRMQDLWALWESGFAVDGYFCEFGALGGKDFSNTYLLERVGWRGVVSEPHPSYTKALYANRRCAISTRCVYDQTGETVSFHTVEGRPALSTIGGFGADDEHREARERFVSHDIVTITLADLFEEAGAPETIDYLSIDTEGSELVILRAFDFRSRPIRLICVEHNDVHREGLYDLLTSQGYERKWPELSGHDDWYVLRGSFPQWSARGMLELVDRVDRVEPFARDFEVRDTLIQSLRLDRQDPRQQLGLPQWQPPAASGPVDRKVALATYQLQRNLLKRSAGQQGLSSRQVSERTLRMFYRLCSRLDPTVVLEVGAFDGHFSEAMKGTLPQATVVAFEANPHVHEKFGQRLAAAGVDYRQVAVTNRPGAVDFYVPKDVRGSTCQPVNQLSSLLPHRGTRQHEVSRVRATTIDDALDPTDAERVVAWVNAGGSCREVFEGMDQTLERTLALFVQVESEAEWSEQWVETQVGAYLVDRGFTLVGVDRMKGNRQFGLVFVNPRLVPRRLVARIASGVYRPSGRGVGRSASGGRGKGKAPAGRRGPAVARLAPDSSVLRRIGRRARRGAAGLVRRLR